MVIDLRQPAVIDPDQPVGVWQRAHIVRDDDDRAASLVASDRSSSMMRRPESCVERGRRLVGQNDARTADQSTRDRDALFLATREIARQGLRLVSQSDRVERASGLGSAAAPRSPRMSSATLTFSIAESAGNRLKPWNTKPSSSRRTRGRSRWLRPVMSRSPTTTRPVVGLRIAPMIESSVVLPLPDGPSMSRTSRGRTSRSTPRSACVCRGAGAVDLGDPIDEDACHDQFLNTIAGSMRVALLMDTI